MLQGCMHSTSNPCLALTTYSVCHEQRLLHHKHFPSHTDMLLPRCLHTPVMLRFVNCRNEDWYSRYAAQGRRNASSRVTVFPLYAPAEQGFLHAKVDPQNCIIVLVGKAPAVMVCMPDDDQQHKLLSMYCHRSRRQAPCADSKAHAAPADDTCSQHCAAVVSYIYNMPSHLLLTRGKHAALHYSL